jgi:hypothetical protein
MRYNGAYTKASYALTYALKRGNERELDLLRDVIKDATETDEVIFKDNDGFIDHQSSDVCADAFLSYDTLKNFIFNKKSYLYTDNDNH